MKSLKEKESDVHFIVSIEVISFEQISTIVSTRSVEEDEQERLSFVIDSEVRVSHVARLHHHHRPLKRELSCFSEEWHQIIDSQERQVLEKSVRCGVSLSLTSVVLLVWLGVWFFLLTCTQKLKINISIRSDLSKLMPEERRTHTYRQSLSNLELLANVVADYHFDYFVREWRLKHPLGHHIRLIRVQRVRRGENEMSSLRREEEVFVVFSDEIKRTTARAVNHLPQRAN